MKGLTCLMLEERFLPSKKRLVMKSVVQCVIDAVNHSPWVPVLRSHPQEYCPTLHMQIGHTRNACDKPFSILQLFVIISYYYYIATLNGSKNLIYLLFLFLSLALLQLYHPRQSYHHPRTRYRGIAPFQWEMGQHFLPKRLVTHLDGKFSSKSSAIMHYLVHLEGEWIALKKSSNEFYVNWGNIFCQKDQ